MNKVFICRQLLFDTRTASMALLTFHCSQSKIHMARACERLITWLSAGNIPHAPRSRAREAGGEYICSVAVFLRSQL